MKITEINEANFPNGIIIPRKYFDSIVINKPCYILKPADEEIEAFVRKMPPKTI